MKSKHIDDIVPEQETGAKTDTEHSITTSDLKEAKKLYEVGKERLQDINNWQKYCGKKASAVFRLTDSDGNEVSRKPQKGDHIKINIPAPGAQAGEGYDWVGIESIEDSSTNHFSGEAWVEIPDVFAIRVRPAHDPRKAGEEVAHFFKDAATSTFAIERHGNTVTASVHGRNEEPNTDTGNILDKVRNAVIALGAMVGLSTPQWKSLVKGLLETH